jgi:AcrR family transcriptional regulator
MTSASTTERKPLDHDTVVNVAGELADIHGLGEVTLTSVAKQLGVRQPALYRHVESYQDLIRSLSLRGRKLLADSMAAAAIGVAGNDAVAAVGHAWRRVAAERPGLFAATDRYPCTGDAELQAAANRIVEVISMSLASFHLDPENRVHAARTLRSASHGFSHIELSDGHPHKLDIDDTFDHMLQLLCAGIRHQQHVS